MAALPMGLVNAKARKYTLNNSVYGLRDRARSSAGEHLVDIEGVTGSIPVVPTTKTPGLKPGVFFTGLMMRACWTDGRCSLW